MSTTVATIAANAFDDVASEFSDVVKACTLTRTTQGAYNPTTGAYATTTTTATGRAIFDTSKAMQDALPSYVAGPAELLVWLEGLSLAPRENDSVTIGGSAYAIRAVGDVVGAGSLFACAVIRS